MAPSGCPRQALAQAAQKQDEVVVIRHLCISWTMHIEEVVFLIILWVSLLQVTIQRRDSLR